MSAAALAGEYRLLPDRIVSPLDDLPGVLAVCSVVLLIIVAPVVYDGAGFGWGPARALVLTLVGVGAIAVIAEFPRLALDARETHQSTSSTDIASPTCCQSALCCPATTVANAASVVRNDDEHTPIGWLQLALLAVFVPVLGRLLLLHRYAGAYWRQARRDDTSLADLLPSQRDTLARLTAAIRSGDRNAQARLVQLVGRWGESKSFLLERLQPALSRSTADLRFPADGIDSGSKPERDPKAPNAPAPTSVSSADAFTVVMVDVWKHQSEPNLHAAVVEEVLSARDAWYPYGWLRYPLSLFLIRAVKQLRFSFKMGVAGIDIPLQLPPLTGQAALARVVARARRQAVRIVIVLDEIDRAAPPVAQAAFTLARRSFDMAGVVVVLAYVDDLVRFKVFNPLVPSLPDLASTMDAVLYGDGMRMPDGAEPAVASIGAWGPWTIAGHGEPKYGRAPRGGPAGGSASARSIEDVGESPAAPVDESAAGLSERFRAALHLSFVHAGPIRRQRLQEIFAAKYIDSPVTLGPPMNSEMWQILFRFSNVRPLALRVLGYQERVGRPSAQLLSELEPEFGERVAAVIGRWRDLQPELPPPPPVRSLSKELARRLDEVCRTLGEDTVTPTFLIAVFLASYEAACLQASEIWS